MTTPFFLFIQLQSIHKSENTLNKKKEIWQDVLRHTFGTSLTIDRWPVSEVYNMAIVQHETEKKEILRHFKAEECRVQLCYIEEPLQILNSF